MRWKAKFSKRLASLPTNVESATRKYVREHLSAWDEKILAGRAVRLGVSLDEAAKVATKPLFMIEIEARALKEHRTVESLLEEYRNKLQQTSPPLSVLLKRLHD